jgi:hypothetical protein
MVGYYGEFCIPTVKLPTHPTHGGDDDFSLPEFSAWCLLYSSRSFDAQNARQLHIGRVPLARDTSERFRPNALMRINTWPTETAGTGTLSTFRFSGLPDS